VSVRLNHGLVTTIEGSAARLATKQAESLALRSPTSGAASVPLDGGALVAFGPGRYVNRAVGVGLGDRSPGDVADALVEFYGARDLPPSLELCPWADRPFVDELRARGFGLEWFRNVYARELDDVPDLDAADVTVLPVGPAEKAPWAAILGEEAPVGSEARRISDEFCDAVHHVPGAIDLLALEGERPIACGSLNVVEGVAWLGGAATLVAFRRHGAQRHLLVHRLRLASELGAEFAAVTASPDGQSARNLEAVGFRLLYTQAVLTRPAG